jgi:hypothetical protein
MPAAPLGPRSPGAVPAVLCLLAALSGCGGSSSSTVASTMTRTAGTTRTPTTTGTATTVGTTTPPGTIANDQVGENVLRLTPAQLRRRFGPPASAYVDARGNPCVFYEVASTPGRGWRFCFHGQKMVSAAGNQPRPGPVR